LAFFGVVCVCPVPFIISGGDCMRHKVVSRG
jgi:DhnA family fructose-bisphosphate aldolase class Ia